MSEHITPLAPSIQISINGTRLGMLQSCQERSVSDLRLITAVGTGTVSAILPAKTHYVITFQHLIIDPNVFPQQRTLHGLRGFTLSLSSGGMTVKYLACEFALLSTRREANGVCIEEAEIYAPQRALLA